MTIFNKLNKIYCINLPESIDRWKSMEQQLCELGIVNRVERISAPKPDATHFPPNVRKSGQFGCTMSHLKALGNALNNSSGHVMIIEDDIIISPDFEQRLTTAFHCLPPNWELIYLGGQPVSPVTLTQHDEIYAAGNMRGSYGYIVHQDAILSLFNHIVDSLMSNATDVEGIYDYILGNYSSKKNSFVLYPIVCLPRECDSIVQQGHRNYTDVVERQWKKFLPSKQK